MANKRENAYMEMQFRKLMILNDLMEEVVLYAKRNDDYALAEIVEVYINKIMKINNEYEES